MAAHAAGVFLLLSILSVAYPWGLAKQAGPRRRFPDEPAKDRNPQFETAQPGTQGTLIGKIVSLLPSDKRPSVPVRVVDPRMFGKSMDPGLPVTAIGRSTCPTRPSRIGSPAEVIAMHARCLPPVSGTRSSTFGASARQRLTTRRLSSSRLSFTRAGLTRRVARGFWRCCVNCGDRLRVLSRTGECRRTKRDVVLMVRNSRPAAKFVKEVRDHVQAGDRHEDVGVLEQ